MSLKKNCDFGADETDVVELLRIVAVHLYQGTADARAVDLAPEESGVSQSPRHAHQTLASPETDVQDEAREGTGEAGREVQHPTEVEVDALGSPVLLYSSFLSLAHVQLLVAVPLLRKRRAPGPELPGQSPGDAALGAHGLGGSGKEEKRERQEPGGLKEDPHGEHRYRIQETMV